MPENLVFITAVRLKENSKQLSDITHYCYIEGYLGEVLAKEEFIKKFSLQIYLGGVRVRNEIGSTVSIVEGNSPYLISPDANDSRGSFLSLPRV